MKSNKPAFFLPTFSVALLAGLLGLFALAPARAEPVEIDRVVAVVDNSVITRYELDARVRQTLRQLARQNTPAPARGQLERQLLERMITEQVLLHLAEASNIRIDGMQLDRTLGNIAARNNMDLPTYRNALEEQGVSFSAFREEIRRQLTIDRLREREVDQRIVITDAEIENQIARQALEGGGEAEYNLAHILLVAPEAAAPEALRALREKAEKIRAELAAGGNFAQVSAAYSDAQNALQGGMLGWRSEAKLPTLFLEGIKGLNPGELSPVLQSPNGFHILKLLDKRGRDVSLVIKQAHARHILIKTNEIVSDQDAQRRLAELRERVVNGDDFDKLARLHSDDLSASKGGDLGWLNPGDTVPAFEQAMDGLKPGELSEPVRSQYGWHLIQVLERRDQDITEERQRLEARRALRERKSEEAFEDWIRQARDRAYVEYRLED